MHGPEASPWNSADPMMPEITDSSEAPGRQLERSSPRWTGVTAAR